jgi:hypothetical protein
MKVFSLTVALWIGITCSAGAFTDEECKAMGGLAEQIMGLRQKEASLSTVLERVGAAVKGTNAEALVRQMVLAAYDQPAWGTAERKVEAIAEYRNAVELQCFKAGG